MYDRRRLPSDAESGGGNLVKQIPVVDFTIGVVLRFPKGTSANKSYRSPSARSDKFQRQPNISQAGKRGLVIGEARFTGSEKPQRTLEKA